MAKFEECDICFEKMKGTATLDCGHTMCVTCCIRHFRTNESCPICRRHVIQHTNDTNHTNHTNDINDTNHTDNIYRTDVYRNENDLLFTNQTNMNHSWPVLFLRHFEKNIFVYEMLVVTIVLTCVLFPNYKVTIEFSEK